MDNECLTHQDSDMDGTEYEQAIRDSTSVEKYQDVTGVLISGAGTIRVKK